MSDWTTILNPAQKKAVESLNGPHLVLAGAGTGKTRVLEYRTLYLINAGIDPASILLLTFTRRAAAEMLARASRHDVRAQRVSGGTFHSFAFAALKRDGRLLGFESFSVLDRGDSEDLAGKIIQDLKLRDAKYFPKKGTVTDIVSKAVNKELPIAKVLEKDYPYLTEWEKALELVQVRFAKCKKERHVMDYDDLLYYFAQLLEQFEHVRRKMSERYRYIMVDEYQDTNKLQSRIVQLLAQEHGNILIVGDEMQSIYAFRGANFENMIDFPKTFASSTHITLEENYRSTQEILNVANAVLDDVQGPHFKKYLSSSRHGRKPIYAQLKSPKEEASYVANKILELVDAGVRLRHMAVLFRAAYQSAPLELELSSLGILFKKFGGIRFIETAHVKDVLAYLRVAENPKDDISWRRILMLLDGIGEKGADALVANLMAAGDYQEILLANVHTAGLARFLAIIDTDTLTPAEKINRTIVYYQPIVRKTYDDYQEREQDLSALADIAASYVSVSDMLDDFVLEPPDKSALATYAQPTESDWLCLSTIHSAKGLEWGTVVVIGVAEGKFPIVRPTSDDEDIEEERRLFYVAVTRPKERLFITNGSLSWGFSRPSRFVEPLINKDLVETYGLNRMPVAFDGDSDLIEYDPVTASFRPKRTSFRRGSLLEQSGDEF